MFMTTWMLTPNLATHLKMKITFLQQQLHNSFEDEDNLSVVAIAPQSSSSLDDADDDVIDQLELYVSDNVFKEPHVSILPLKQGFANILTRFPIKNMQNFGILITTNRTQLNGK